MSVALARQFELTEDTPPLDLLSALCAARGWQASYHGDDLLLAEVDGEWRRYRMRCHWRGAERVLQLVCVPDIRVPSTKRTLAADLLARINEQLWLGHFDLLAGCGTVMFRHAALLGQERELDLAQAQGLADAAIDACDRFFPAFQFLLWGDKSPAEALGAALIDPVGEA